MAETKSDWRLKARQIIEAALAGVPDDTPPAQVRKILRHAYPWGERVNHPYVCWCQEVRAAMKKRGQRGADGEPKVLHVLERHGKPIGVPKDLRASAAQQEGLVWLTVSCGWCADKIAGGCMQCITKRQKVKELVRDPEFLSLREAASDGDMVALAALGDWLEEQFGTRC